MANCNVRDLSEITLKEAEALIGLTIAKVDAGEYSLELTFTDESTLTIKGSRWGGCSLGVSHEAGV